MSIRTKLTIAVAVMLMGTITLLGIAFVRSTRAALIEQVDEQVVANAVRTQDWRNPSKYDDKDKDKDKDRDGRGVYDDRGSTYEPIQSATSGSAPDVYIAVARFVFAPNGTLIYDEPCGFTTDPKPPPDMPPIPSEEVELLVNRIVTTPSVDGSFDYRMLVQQTAAGETIVTASPLDDVEAAVSKLIRTLVVIGAAALALTTAAAWWLIRRGMQPVDHMVATAAAIAGGDLTRRVTDPDPRTELGRLGGALNEMLGRIEAALEARAASEARLRRFVADAAHELRTPLTSLRGYAELYRQGAIADEAAVGNAMARIEAESARMTRLVEELLLLARLDQQRGLEMKPFDLSPLVQEAVADFKAIDPERPVSVAVMDAVTVNGDRARLRQVLDNLLTNARIHTPAGTPVRVTLTTRDGFAEIRVADEGPGIAKEDQAKIFERFWRADPARARRTGGSGLGLAIVASLVEAHGGSVSVESAPGQGATFVVRLPLTDASRPGAARQSSSNPGPAPAAPAKAVTKAR